MTAREKEQLEAEARAAVLVRRSDLPVPLAHAARNFFGGLPKLPPEIEWPKAEVREAEKKEYVALTFIAQIDLAELPTFKEISLLPHTGTLYFFCSSLFAGEGNLACRVFYYAGNAGLLPDREPPPDVIPLTGDSGAWQIKRLDPITNYHSTVEFKYPISFRPFRDFEFYEDPVGGELFVESLCEALGPGEPVERDLLKFRNADGYAKDDDWPFNWLLITHVVRLLLAHIQDDLRTSPYRSPNEETRETLQGMVADANRWLERCGRLPPLEIVDTEAKETFRVWWLDVVSKYEKLRELKEQIWTFPHQLPEDLGDAINHNIRYIVTHDERALVHVADKYVANLKRQNHWKTPTAKQGKYRFFSSAIHQMLGYGSSWQGAPFEHRGDVLLLQIQGDDAFFRHRNCGCVLHFWIGRDALSKLDFSAVEATLECD